MEYYKAYTILMDCCCWIDIGVNFLTGFVVKKSASVELRPAKIARKYASSAYFICDVLSSIPKCALYYDYTMFIIDIVWVHGLIMFFNLLKIVRSVSLITCLDGTARYFRSTSKGALFLFYAIIISLGTIHWMACLQVAIPKLVRYHFSVEPQEEFVSWLYINEFKNASMSTRYVHSLFKSSAFILGIRLPFYNIMLIEDFVVAIVSYLIGKILIGTVWIMLAGAILRSRSMEIKLLQVINELDEYMRKKQMPLNLKAKISQYYDFKYNKLYFREDSVLNLLSKNIKTDINIHIYKSLINNVSLFSYLSPQEVNYVLGYLEPEIYLPNDIIILSGNPGEAMYFLSCGTVAVYTRSGKEICHLQDGSHFGEIALILKSGGYNATVRAIEPSQVYKLSRKHFEMTLRKNKKVLKRLITIAETRLNQSVEIEEQYKRQLFKEHYASRS
ncbi:hypothetical protein NQ314_019092 [Rhamnusium bicolor]|uniref:Cyclic nucleotide-binding domain-containing protein n=1 Tax=Rhamnusium bicolor TaxID=1586634 RepID=A0AAV8WRI8_9CUCU|nr:hypothetical protein NQ314_019092 [Rhamnusium bicolor]